MIADHDQGAGEVHHGRRAERAESAVPREVTPLGDERHDDELQANQRAAGRAHDHVETFPGG